MARIELSNIGGGGGTTLSLTTTGTSGAATLAGSVLNIPIYQGQLTLTTTGTSGAATLVGNTLNIPQYSGGGGTPAGSAGQVQFNSTPAGSFAASANLAWDNSNVRLNIGAPSAPTGKLNIRGGGTTSSTVNLRLTDSGNTELFKVLDNGSANIGTGFNWDNVNSRLGIGTASPSFPLDVTVPNASGFRVTSTGDVGMLVASSGTNNVAYAQLNSGNGTTSGRFAYFSLQSLETATQRWDVGMRGNKDLVFFDHATGSTVLQLSSQGASAGNVSIGTTIKDARLQVRSAGISGAATAFVVQNSAPSNLFIIRENGKILYLATNTAAGTTGAQTINQPSGTVNFGIGAGSLVVTNSLCTTSSIVFATVRTNDATAYIKNVVPAGGSFTINLGAAATAETSVGFFIIN